MRVRAMNDRAARRDGKYVLYWMIAARRPAWNDALDRAVEWARALDRPLIVLEPLRVGYRWASDRFHRFVLEGMADNAAAFDGTGVLYHPYVEPRAGDGRGLLEAFARDACVVVTDDYPTFFLPRMVAAAAAELDVLLEAVDGNGLLPLRDGAGSFARAFDFRRHLQKTGREHVARAPRKAPRFGDLPPRERLPAGIADRWPRATDALLAGDTGALAALPIDHAIPPAPLRGGHREGRARLKAFTDERLADYGSGRNTPDDDASSGLSPWLHFGHLSAHEVFAAVARAESWSPAKLGDDARGKREGWWGTSASAEAFLDELVTWRELGYRWCAHEDGHEDYDALPAWARETLEDHERDPRPHVYTLEQFEAAATHDDLWNAAQNQLRVEGRIHNYLRMLWGKKILHWSRTPREAFATMIELNNKYALDGRDPNSCSGISWVLGRFDRAWGPEREVFGKVRYMTSANTRRKMSVGEYVGRWSDWQLSLDF